MTQIGLFFGSSTGNTAAAADLVVDALQEIPSVTVDLYSISKRNIEKMNQYSLLIFGCPTWNIGELQDDWALVMSEFQKLDLTGKQVALFGYGDQYAYPNSYQDALGIIALYAVDNGAEIAGFWPTDGYEFEDSQAVFGDMFVGLALDDSQIDQAGEIVAQWVAQLAVEFMLEAELVSPSQRYYLV
jgi:flavodoxin I